MPRGSIAPDHVQAFSHLHLEVIHDVPLSRPSSSFQLPPLCLFTQYLSILRTSFAWCCNRFPTIQQSFVFDRKIMNLLAHSFRI
ncbi:hypothetical protein L208DRAFT_1406074 [Tricholoma matsutake]|nr:hypothetical protein L208DRAFT_1415464 [Tricholoma matsutake 945]KAF8227028.1 hypothetical protein L208DRAFT_1406074 [Tricholoma matsutake 945]